MNLRHRFCPPDPPDAVELRAFTHGLMPTTVPAMMQRFTDDWRRLGADAWNEVPNHWRPDSGDSVGWWTLPEYLGDQFIAPLLDAPPGTCILQPNVHWTMQCLFSAPEVFDGRNEVVLTSLAFPSVLHSAQRWAELLDLSLRIIPPRSDGYVDCSAVLNAIGTNTALVVLSHVGFTTGEKLSDVFLQRAAEAVHNHGGLLALDGYHSVCTMPIEVEALGADLYFGGLLKEGCGASGNTFVYIRLGLDLTPRLSGWFGDAAPFDFADSPSPHPDARRRFLGGTTAVASRYHAIEGVRILLDAGLDAVRTHSLQLTDYCIDRAEAADLTLRSPRPPVQRGAMMILDVPDAYRLCAYLKQRHIYTDSRKNRYLRLAPFVWNTEGELKRTFEVIEEAIETEAYRAIDISSDAMGPVT